MPDDDPRLPVRPPAGVGEVVGLADSAGPHGNEDRVLISGTKVRAMLSEGEMPPKEFSRPEVVQILMEYYRNLEEEK